MPDKKMNTPEIISMLRMILAKMETIERKIMSCDSRMTDDDARVWTPKDVQRKFGIGLKQQYNLRKKGILPYSQKTAKGPVRYLPPDIIGYFMGDDMP